VNPALQLSSRLGLFPLQALAPSEPVASVFVQTDRGDGVHRIRLRGLDARTQALISRLAAAHPNAGTEVALGTAAAARFCRDEGFFGEVATLWINERESLEFECGSAGTLARVR
jgi:hypothetical protein